MECWGFNNHGQIDPPQNLEPAKQLAAGGGHTCALNDGGKIRCWGDPNFINPPSDLGLVAQLTAGDDYTCALKEDGSVQCWGGDSEGAKVPVDLEHAALIEARGCNTCSIGSRNGKLRCWGCNSFSQTEVPPQFVSGAVQVAVGYSDHFTDIYGHICGLTHRGDVICWGSNSQGQRNVPEGIKVAPGCAGKLASVSHGKNLLEICKFQVCGLDDRPFICF